MADPICTVEARYWRAGLRGYEIVLQVMYYTSATRGRGQGPFFVVDRVRREKVAAERVAEMNDRLKRSEDAMAEEMHAHAR